MTLGALQRSLCELLRGLECLRGVRVLSEDEGNILAEWDAAMAKSHLAVTVGAAAFTPTSRDSRVVVGTASLAVNVWERPSRNRVGQGLAGPTAGDVAEAIACAAHLAPIGDGVLVLTGIGGVARIDEQTVARTVNFETLATLTGE